MPHEPSLAPRPSKQLAAWEKAIHGGDAALLKHLVFNDELAAARLELETDINGLYCSSLHPLSISKTEIESKMARVLPYVDESQARLGWRVREFDLGLLRLIRRSSTRMDSLGRRQTGNCWALLAGEGDVRQARLGDPA